jgi:hypothetical protein
VPDVRSTIYIVYWRCYQDGLGVNSIRCAVPLCCKGWSSRWRARMSKSPLLAVANQGTLDNARQSMHRHLPSSWKSGAPLALTVDEMFVARRHELSVEQDCINSHAMTHKLVGFNVVGHVTVGDIAVATSSMTQSNEPVGNRRCCRCILRFVFASVTISDKE